jgi:hypothetical protein
MRFPLRALLAAGVILLPGAVLAQMVIAEPPPMAGEVVVAPPAGVVVVPPQMMGPPTIEDARMIAMANGLVTVEDVDTRFWDGNYEVEGTDQAGEDIEIVIDGQTGQVLEIDD